MQRSQFLLFPVATLALVVVGLVPLGSLAIEPSDTSPPPAATERASAEAEVPPGDTHPGSNPDPGEQRADGDAPQQSSLPSPQNQPDTEQSIASTEPSSYMKLTGRIRRVESGFAFVRTPVGTITLFSNKGLRKTKRGQTVTLWTHESNVVVDIYAKGDGVLVHRFITGVPTFTSPAHDEIQLWTPEGGQTISLDGQPVKIATVSEDDPLTVQLNQSGQVIGQPRLNIDIQIAGGTKKRTGTTLKLTGTVSRVKAGFAFVDTPIGPLTLSKKTGLRNVKAGQEVTVWLTEHHLVIDVRQKGEPAPARRFVTGKVTYTSEDKSHIKLWMPEGEKTISLPSGGKKRRPFREGTPITVQFNGSGEVVDIRKVR